MIKAIEEKAFGLFYKIYDSLQDHEEGQTTTEYVAVTAVGLVIAIGVLYTILRSSINVAVSSIASRLTAFVTTAS